MSDTLPIGDPSDLPPVEGIRPKPPLANSQQETLRPEELEEPNDTVQISAEALGLDNTGGSPLTSDGEVDRAQLSSLDLLA